MTLFSSGEQLLSIPAANIKPADVLLRRIEWRVQNVRHLAAINPQAWPFHAGRPARVLVRCHRESANAARGVTTLELAPDDLVIVRREISQTGKPADPGNAA